MIFGGEFVSGIDLVDICLWLFTIFFFGLVLWLHRETHREGYPLETDQTGKLEEIGEVWMPAPKTFRLPHGRGQVSVPPGEGDKRDMALERVAVWAGSPYRPTGDPLVDGVGPASYTERMDVPDLTDDGQPRIVPLRSASGYYTASKDANPVGMTVYGADGEPGGVVKDLWVDRAEAIFRYYELENEDSGNRILLPVPFAVVKGKEGRILVDAIFGHHFKNVPITKNPDQVTRLEEDKIQGYYGGGKLYATAARTESLA